MPLVPSTFDWTEPNPLHFCNFTSTLYNSWVKLEPVQPQDLQRLLTWVDSPEFLLQWAGPSLNWPLTRSQLETLLLETQGPTPTRMAFKAVSDDGFMTAYAEITGIDRKNRSASIARVIVAPESRALGIGSWTVAELLWVAFEQLYLHRVSLNVLSFNTAAIRAYERTGFRHEGTLRDAYVVGGRFWSVNMMSILEPEWRKPDQS
jgi:RimJ/RimL family protein N-acetyltransferase